LPILKKTALIEDLSDGQFFQHYAFTREDRGEGFLELRPADADNWRSFRDRLRNRNAHPSLLTKSTVEAAAASAPETRFAYAAAAGWRPGRKTFVLPDLVIGANTKSICGLPPRPVDRDRRVHLRIS
jgi:hypothetical protein